MPQPLIGAATLAFALIVLGVSWFHEAGSGAIGQESAGIWLLTLCLVVGVPIAYWFPIYIRHSTKICVTTIPLYLMAALLPPPLAATAAGLGILSGEMAVRAQRRSHLSDVATHAGRWILLGLAGSVVAHLPVPAGAFLLHGVLLLGTGLVLLAGDVLTLPLALYPITGEHPKRLILACIREGGAVEAAQYVLAVVGAIVALQQVWALAALAVPSGLVYLLYKKNVDPDTQQLLESMADAVDLRSPYTIEHSHRVVELARGVLEELGMRGQEAAYILVAARVHDIGKTKIPDQLLSKASPLTPEERAVLETHAQRGAELLQHYPDFARVVDMVRHHHERWDGTGYPHHLKGVEIPFGARVIAVAESFDAMTTDQALRRALPVDRTAATLLDGAGRQWDPAIVDAFLRSIADRLEQPMGRPPISGAPRAAPPNGLTQTL